MKNLNFLWIRFWFLLINLSSVGIGAPIPNTLLHIMEHTGTNSQTGTSFGDCVAANDEIIAIGSPGASLSNSRSGTVSIFSLESGALLHSLTNPGPAGSFNFGSTVAVFGNTVVVGSYGDSRAGRNSGACFVYDLPSLRPTEASLTLTNPTPLEDEYFGVAVAISGSRILIGAGSESSGVLRAGAAYLYDLNHSTPSIPIAFIPNPSPSIDAGFGYAVAFAGTKGIVGRSRSSGGQLGSGRFYVYEMGPSVHAAPNQTLANLNATLLGTGEGLATHGTTVVLGSRSGARVYNLTTIVPSPNPIATLTNPAVLPPANLNGSFFGSAVAIWGNRVLVSDPSFADLTNASGTFYVGRVYSYDLPPNGATSPLAPAKILTNLPGRYGDRFGRALAASSSKSVVGLPGADLAYVYEDGSTTPAQALKSFNPSAGDNFGRSISISGNRLITGAPADDSGAEDAGFAFVYELESPTPNRPVVSIPNPEPNPRDNFGRAVAISGNRIAVGVPGADIGGTDVGVAFVYDLNSPTPAVPTLTLTNPSPFRSTGFGSGVALNGNRLVIGSPIGENGGDAYVYELSSATHATHIGKLSSAHDGRFGQTLAVSDSRIVVGAFYEAGAAGRVYIYDYSASLKTNPTLVLENPLPGRSQWFGRAVSEHDSRLVIGACGFGSDTGRAYLFDLAANNAASPAITFVNPFSSNYDLFGSSVAIYGSIVAIGTMRQQDPIDAGKVLLYDLSSASPSIPFASLTHPHPYSNDSFGASPIVGSLVAMDQSNIVVGAPGRDTIAIDRGATYVFGLQPSLAMTRVSSESASLSWFPRTSAGFMLQKSTTLSPSSWENCVSGETNPIVIPFTGDSEHYRLLQKP
jgi:hypothetical protein